MNHQEIGPADAARLIGEGRAVLIDVRGADEFRARHIPYAMSVPLPEVTSAIETLNLPPEATVIFQCQSGMRGGQACAMTQAGLGDRARNLAGGIVAWQAAGLPVVGAEGGPISIFRQVQIVVGTLVLLCTLAGLSGLTAGYYLAALFGFMLAFAGLSGWCGLALLLQRLPWNRVATG